MVTQAPTPEIYAQWKELYAEYAPKLLPNRRPAADIVAYLQEKYPVVEQSNGRLEQVVIANVLSNECYYEKLPPQTSPKARTFFMQNTGRGKLLYENQDEFFCGDLILIGIEMYTGFFYAQGSSELWDDLFAFRGLDEDDLCNIYLVAEYVLCLRKFRLLESVLCAQKN
ncbi:MAG: hypothetical protein ACOYJB_01345 [Christensenellaceae bacterium]|jgi:hypothetical protein